MAFSDEINPNEAIGEAVKGALDSVVAKNLLGPLTFKFGLALGDLADICHFYLSENLEKVFKKWGEQRHGEPLDESELRRVLPLLQNAAMQSNDEMQEKWAALLESTAKGGETVLPSFGHTLSQITPEEAHFLERVWSLAMRKPDYLPPNLSAQIRRTGREWLLPSQLRQLFDPRLAEYSSTLSGFSHRMAPQERAAFERLRRFELVLHDIERLGILSRETKYFQGDELTYEVEGEEIKVPQQGGTKTFYTLTQYGVDFINAVRPKPENPSTNA